MATQYNRNSNVGRLPVSYSPRTAASLNSARAAAAAARPLSGSSTSPGSYLSQLQSIAGQNNAWSAQQAANQMAYQTWSADRAMAFNASEADKNRKWQEMMSNTAHQREVKDLIAAGINPVLTATGGSGAPVTSGATASGYSQAGAKGETDMSTTGAFVNLLGSMLSAQTQLASTAMSAQSNQAIADKTNALNKFLGELQSQTYLTTSRIQAAASAYAADRHVDASYLSSSIAAAAARYGYDVTSMTQREIAAFNASVNSDLQQRGFQHDFDLETAFPSNVYRSVSSVVGQLTGDSGLSSAVTSAKSGLSQIFDTIKRGYNLTKSDISNALKSIDASNRAKGQRMYRSGS